MAQVVVRLPGVLAQMNGGERRVEVDGASVREALDDLVRRRPALGHHLFDEHGVMRRHVRCFCNSEYASERDGLDAPVRVGDTITLLNSVSGG